jgi:hypothetical protein
MPIKNAASTGTHQSQHVDGDERHQEQVDLPETDGAPHGLQSKGQRRHEVGQPRLRLAAQHRTEAGAHDHAQGQRAPGGHHSPDEPEGKGYQREEEDRGHGRIGERQVGPRQRDVERSVERVPAQDGGAPGLIDGAVHARMALSLEDDRA